MTRWHTKEGSFINRSLLALGSVIAKLSEGAAAHVPFRDSKLTRVLASSLTGSGARIAVVCTVTPGSSQAEETHNTLKFATRAKRVRARTPAQSHHAGLPTGLQLAPSACTCMCRAR